APAFTGAPGAARTPDYLPWLAGKTLHYRVTIAAGAASDDLELVRTFGQVSPDGREATLMAAWLHLGNPLDHETVRVRRGPDGYEAADPAVGTWAPFLKLPLAATHTYAVPSQILISRHFPAVPQRVAQTGRGVETVTVPAGRYAAYRVDLRLGGTLAGAPFSQTAALWLAPGVGEVRFEQHWEGVSLVRELTEIEP
ncbi:MAG: hypothetical protein FJZ01_20420, partial [Candidatus Sericytochromatia bacterium]|nr:hypothetical protein [Candidatus Tanganyikabacteria bacterium]